MLLSILFILCLLIFNPLNNYSQEAKDSIKLLHISDIHFCELDQYHPLFSEKRNHFGNVFDDLSILFDQKSHEYDAMIFTGDMIDYFEAGNIYNRMISSQIEQFSRFINSLNKNNLPIYMTLGNHDVASYWIDNGKLLYTQTNFEMAKSDWIRNVDCFRYGVNYKVEYNIENTWYILYFIDNSYYNPTRQSNYDQFLIDQKNLLWIEEGLRNNPSAISLIFMHMPLIRHSSEEIDYYKQNTHESDSLGIKIVTVNQIDSISSNNINILNIISKYPHVKVIVCGHQHENIINNIILGNNTNVYQVMTGAYGRSFDNWGEKANSWRNIVLKYDRIDIYNAKSNIIKLSIPIK